MGTINNNILDDGFTVTYDDGTKETFRKNMLDDNYHGNKGSKINSHYLDDGFTVHRYDGRKESFHKNWLDDNLSGDSGTHINKNRLDDNYHTYNTSNNSSGRSNGKIDLSWMDRDQHVNNAIGIGAAILNGIILKLIGMGWIRVIASSIIVAIVVAGTLDTIKDVKKKKYKTNILVEGVIGDIIGAIILIPLYIFIIGSYF